MKKTFLLALIAAFTIVFSSCSKSDDDPVTPPNTENPTPPGGSSSNPDEPSNEPDYPLQPSLEYAKGADISWVTEMESRGVKFYDKQGEEKECFALMKELGVNAIRLRVWVNPANGWNGKADVVKKALRAKAQGMPVMIDFHYSDSWADPGKQNPPAAWAGYSLEELKTALADHTTDVLQALKARDVNVQWVQVGNETSWGMLWETGKILNDDFTNFTQLVNAGYDAVKSVYPSAQVIVHTDRGQEWGLQTWMYDGLKAKGAKYDVIGLSLYPENVSWERTTTNCINNIKSLIARYDKPVMVCEVGMPWDASNAAAFMQKIVSETKTIDRCQGVFYWEPQCYDSWNNYTKGAFDKSGRPTAAMDAFAD